MHPIYPFVQSNNTALQHLVRPPPSPSHIPTISSLRSSVIHVPTDISKPQTSAESSPLLAPFELVTTAPFKVNSALPSNFSHIVGSPKSLSPMKPSSKRKTEESTSKISQKFTVF